MTTIPVCCTAKLAVAPADLETAKQIARQAADEVRLEHKQSDPGLTMELLEVPGTEPVMPEEVSRAVISLLHLLPAGLADLSLTFPGLPISSFSLETIDTTQDGITSGAYARGKAGFGLV